MRLSKLLALGLLSSQLWLNTTLGAGGRNERGVLEIQLKDHREAIGDFSQIKLLIDKILLSPRSGLQFWRTGWQEISSSSDSLDLTQLTGKKAARVFRGEIDAGAFDAFNVEIKNITAVLKKTGRSASIKNTVGPVKLAFEVPAQGETLLIIDLVVTDFSDHPPRGYELAIKGYELYTNGKLVAKIPPE
ncbi:MAG TPA: DUF4382 domain-containing protein [Candidatus Binatia bacterium]